MATELGQAYVQIMPSAKGISGAIQNAIAPEASAAGKSAGSTLGSTLVKAVTGVIAAAGIGKAFTAALSEGAALQQSLGGVETLFKDSAGKVKRYAEEAYKTTGLSANAYMESVTGFSASLLQSLGGDTNKAAEVAHMAMVDMSDNANKMGTSMDRIQDAYQGFAKQNYTMLDNLKLGYGGTKTEMERLLADAEKLTGVKYDINNLSDVYQAIHAIQENLDITGTTAKEAASTFSGSFAAMKAAAQNVLGDLALGEDIEPSLIALAETTSTFFFDNFIPMVGNILKGIPDLVGIALREGISRIFGGEVAAQFEEGWQGLFSNLSVNIDFSGILTTIQPVIDGLKTAFGQLPALFQSVVSAVQPVITTLVNGFSRMDFSGIQSLIEAILPALQAGFEQFVSIAGPAIDKVVQSFVALWNAAQPLISILVSALTPAFQVLGSFLGGVFNGIMTGLTALFDGLKLAIEFLTPVFNVLVQAFQACSPVLNVIAEGVGFVIGLFANLGSVGEGLSGIMSSAWSNIQNVLQTAASIIDGAISWIKTAFSGAGNAAGVVKNIIDIAWMAIGDVINTVKGVISSAMSAAGGAFNSFSSVVSSVSGTINNIINGVKNTFNSLAHIDLSGAGSAIMNGFLGGLKSAWQGVTDFVGGIAGWIRDHKGPIEYDKRLLIPAGKAIMNGLNEGLKNQFKSVQSTVSGMAGEIYDSFGTVTFDTNFSDINKASAQLTLSNNRLASQLNTDSGQDYDYKDVMDILAKLANRPTVVSVQADRQEIAKIYAEPVAEEQAKRQAILNAVDGLGW
ncbi:phage tail protein [Streptococcus sp. KS 6]|uniref:phage tail protein n=1 Tax=Streptococcus sp. KS 6 TaxID=2598457 RepID=UPI001785D454|nr:phage tail protein [Streptococcus sp. KS 6]QOG25516.1 phage tail protein [Streptococcus sp. KS 6]